MSRDIFDRELFKRMDRSKQVYYTYIDTDEKRFSTHAPNIEIAKKRRDRWIERKEKKLCEK